MPKPVPTPIAAAIGLVPAVLGGVRALPGKVVSIPLLAVGSALSTLDHTRRSYDDLAERGERLIARLTGTSLDEVEDAVEDALQGTPVAGLYDAVEDAAEDAAAGVGRALRSVTGGAEKAARNAGEAVEETARAATTSAAAATATGAEAGAPAEAAVPDDEAPKGEPTPKATPPDTTRVDSAAAPSAVRAADRVTSDEVVAHDDLPLADYDHMTLGSLRGRLRSLSVEQLAQVRAYEKAHADRLPVVTMLDNRIAKMLADANVEPTGNVDAPTVPELQSSQIGQGGSKVSRATRAPKQNPPSQGEPTNPAQPR